MSVVIKGNSHPKIGKREYYSLSSSDHEIKIIKWAVHREKKLLQENKSGSFQFEQKALGNTYYLKVDYHDLTLKKDLAAGAFLYPVEGEPAITKITWEDCNYNNLKGREIAYLDPLYLVIQTANIPRGGRLEITVWEDEWISGHGDSSTNMGTLYAFVKKNGQAEIELSSELLQKYMEKANAADLFKNDDVHDYYIQIKYSNKINSIEDKTQVKVRNKLVRLVEPEKGERVVLLDDDEADRKKYIIFPLLQKPDNDTENKWGKKYYWGAATGDNQTTYLSNRSNRKRKHAGRDLYTPALSTVVAIADGVVLEVKEFYSKTDQVTVKHKTEDGREFIIRYGELDPQSIIVKKGDEVKQNQILGKTGKLIGITVISGQQIYMLHFEHFTGREGLNLKIKLSNDNIYPFYRRKDLIDPLAILKEGYRNSFEIEEDEEDDGRIHPSKLKTSASGIQFIKDWETFRGNLYDNDGDSIGNATIGYGHLVHKGKINGSESDEFKAGISEEKATELLKEDLLRMENAVQRDITVKLHQYEFDALISLLFNTGESFLIKGAKGKPTELLLKINDKEYTNAAEEFLDVTNGKISGLVKRRNAENNMFLNNIYNSSH